MSIQPFSRTNRAVQSLPKHLLQFAVDQRYEEYTRSITRSGVSSCARTFFS